MHDISEAASESTGRHNIEVWNDLVSIKDLLICLQISAAYAACAALLSIVVGGQPLFWGLGASVIGFTVNCFFVTPKRDVTIIDDVSDAGIADDSDDDSSGDPSGEPGESGEESEDDSDATASENFENSDDNSDKGGAE